MNENSSNDSRTDATLGDQPPASADSTDSAAPTPVEGRKARSVKGIVWLILVAVAAGVAGAAYWYVTQGPQDDLPNPNDERISNLSTSLDAARDAINELGARIDELASRTAGREQKLQTVEGQLNERLRQLESLPGRVGNLEGSMASLRGISSGLRDSWLLAEAEYYMQIANAQLQLAGNPALAILALQLADEKIQQLANPALTDIRRALAEEQRSLEAVGNPDIEGIALTLSSLAAVADSLPLDNEIKDSRSGDAADVDAELGGMDRFFASLRKTASDIVSVRRSDEEVQPLIAPEAQYFLRANLALQFQAARLALLRGEQALFDQSLDDAATWLNRYYDTRSEPVQSALNAIAKARQSVIPTSLPDISGSLKLLREYRVLSAAQRPAPTRAVPAAEDGDPQ
ncbi:MAG: uroporphyrinogen-III C-methyltransferase [Gammaproteobacteria bacterium]|nr:uroporphyrinogen-III C-methyltransferase [Gammaproteobacteria bacterium]MDH4314449.1 uroporphyrinogen-III C-methyltransferase [Gammaproteobacteria bacterium]MDH5213298.1 uroporphyrinogen-III C-methyltransferase [Gammaproteobacteria bacterium]MDH5499829.1 uroporphyrinogen-III C-methyltransferase [Gammaproteobacteria bacterium]